MNSCVTASAQRDELVNEMSRRGGCDKRSPLNSWPDVEMRMVLGCLGLKGDQALNQNEV